MSKSSEKLFGDGTHFESFIQQYDNEEFRNKVCEQSDDSEHANNAALDIYFSEMRFGYQFLKEHLPAGKLRILEVGAGLGILSMYLQKMGHEAVALEPSGLSFGLFGITKDLIWAGEAGNLPKLLDKTAEEIDPDIDGTFDFIFSINVMEHIDDIDTATDAILAALKPDGVCINSCPNYLVPYEPHYAIPMIPFMPGMTRKLFAKRIEKDPDIWETFNFISLPKVRRMASRNDANVTFEKQLIYKSFKRLGDDQEFMARHRDGPVGMIYRFLSATRLLNLLKFIPPALNTPMVFTYSRKRQA